MFHLPELSKNINWRNYIIGFSMIGFAFLLIFGNFKSQNHYATLKAAKKEMLQHDSQARSLQVFQTFDKISIECVSKNCTVTCHGDMNSLNSYLQATQGNCSSMVLHISNAIFPQHELQSNWLQGTFNLSSIRISSSKLIGIHNGAFNQESVARLAELELNDVEISTLTESTFIGLRAIKTFTLVNRIETFSGKAFLQPMMWTLKKLVIKHLTNTSTDPGPWLQGESFPYLQTIVFDGSNFGEYINAATFDHLKLLSTLTMNSCNITRIADGSFDFMMKQVSSLISLKNNQLRRLEGEYLSMISSDQLLDIQNNPWDCTCELEHLSRAFKECPECFGDDSKCSTPPHLAGKLLNQITLKRCEDEPLFPLETTPSDTTTPVKFPDTTPPSQSHNTTISANSIFIECTRHKLLYSNYPSTFIELPPPDGHFEIISISETSIRLVFEDPTDDLSVIWFYEESTSDGYGAPIRFIRDFDIGCQTELDISFLVEGLVANQSYTFCLFNTGRQVISPLNCKSYFSAVHENAGGNDRIWLRTKDKPMVIGVLVGSIVVSTFLGLMGMFLLIRYNPWLLRTSKQVEIDNKDNGIYQSKTRNPSAQSSFGNSFHSEVPTAHLRRFSSDSGLSYMMANNYEELEYYRRTNVSLILSNRVPKSPAPPLPPLPRRLIDIKEVKAQYMDKNSVYMKDNDDGYTSVV